MIRLPRFLFFLAASPLAAMTPPSLSVNVMPRSPLSLASGTVGEGWGVSLSVWNSDRRRLFAGRRRIDNPLRERSSTTRTTLAVDASPFPRWTFLAALPHVRARASFSGGLQRVEGPGDLLLLAQYAAAQDRAVDPRRQFRLLAGVELPTGETAAEEGGIRLPASQQPGSNSTDGLVGAAASWALARLSLHGDLTWKIQGGAAYKFGDTLAVHAGVNFPWRAWSATLDLSAEAAGRDTSSLPGPGVRADKKVRDSGHESAALSPGLQWRAAPGWTLSAGVQLPLYQNYRGAQLASTVNATAGAHARFGGPR